MRKSQFTLRSDHHNVYTKKINKIALSSNDDKRIQSNDKITTYPYGYFDNNEIVDIKEDNTKSAMDILREEAKALRNNSKILRKEANTIRNNSKILREKVNNIIKEYHAIKENNTKSELDILREEANALRNNSIILREEANTIRNNSKILREEINDIIKESHAIKNNNAIHRKKINDNTYTKIIKLQRDYILLVKDIEISSKKFICERFLYTKFRDKLTDDLRVIIDNELK